MKKIIISEKKNPAQRRLMSALESYLTNDVNVLLTNGSIGSVLQDCVEYVLSVENFEKQKFSEIYNIGKLVKVKIMIDPNMRCDDNKIILKKDETILDEIEVVDELNELL